MKRHPSLSDIGGSVKKGKNIPQREPRISVGNQWSTSCHGTQDYWEIPKRENVVKGLDFIGNSNPWLIGHKEAPLP